MLMIFFIFANFICACAECSMYYNHIKKKKKKPKRYEEKSSKNYFRRLIMQIFCFIACQNRACLRANKI